MPEHAPSIALERIETVTMPAGKTSTDPNKVQFKFIWVRNNPSKGRLSLPSHHMETYPFTFNLRCGISGQCISDDIYNHLTEIDPLGDPKDTFSSWSANLPFTHSAGSLCDEGGYAVGVGPNPYLLERVESITMPAGKGSTDYNKARLKFIFTAKGRLSTPSHHMETYVRQFDILCGRGTVAVQADFMALLQGCSSFPADPSKWDNPDAGFTPAED